MIPLTSMNTVFRILDTETTGLEPPQAAVCEVAFADVRADGTILRTFETLVDPGHPIPPSAAAVHHITDDQVAGKPRIESLLEDLTAPVYVAHNAEFDSKFLRQLRGQWLCTYRLAKHLWPEAPGHGLQTLRYWLGLQPDIPAHTSAHRALADVMVTVSLLGRALAEVRARWPEVQTVEDLIDRVSGPCELIVIPFKSANGQKFADAETSLLHWIITRGAGGPDCVHSAQKELDRRFPSVTSSEEDDDGRHF